MEYFAKKLLGSSTGVIRKKVIKNEIQSSVHISETRHLICKKKIILILKTVGKVIRTIGVPFTQYLLKNEYTQQLVFLHKL